MNELLSAMTSVLVAWLGLGFVFTGLGLMVRRTFGVAPRDASSLLACFWMGWALAIAILQLWHLKFPVDWRAFVLVSTIGIVGLLWNTKDLWDVVTRPGPRKWVFYSILILVAIWLANRAINLPTNYDSGLYHVASVRWTTAYPIVPGLGNLHGRLAFNSSYFLYVAMLEIGPWIHKSHHIANGLLLLVLFAQVLLSYWHLLKTWGRTQVHHVFNLLLLPPLMYQLMGWNVSSPSPDLAIFVLSLVLSAQLLGFLMEKYPPKEAGYAMFFMTTIAVVGITVKLSFTILGGLATLVALIAWMGGDGIRDGCDRRWVLTWMAISIAMISIPWMIRGVILSGYIAYPSTVGAFPVEWRIPRESVVDIANYVRTWYVKPNVHWSKVLGTWDWFNPWVYRVFREYFYDAIVPLFLGVIGCLTLCYQHRRIFKSGIRRDIWLFLMLPIGSLVFWFVASANPRYAVAWFWLLAAGAMSFAAGTYNDWRRTEFVYGIVCLAIVLSTVPLFKLDKFLGPGDSSGFYVTPTRALKTFTTGSGLLVYVPRKGDQCWEAPLPCTPYPNVSLRLRKKGDMGHGFMMDSGEGVHAAKLQ